MSTAALCRDTCSFQFAIKILIALKRMSTASGLKCDTVILLEVHLLWPSSLRVFPLSSTCLLRFSFSIDCQSFLKMSKQKCCGLL